MKILLVDDHMLFAKSLSIALSDFSEVEKLMGIADLTNLEEVIRSEEPDILLMDINLGRLAEGDGLVLAKQVLEQFSTQKIVMLSGYDLPVYRKEAKGIGTMGFVNKEVEPEELLHILCGVMEGKSHFPHEDILVEDLTDSEKQILGLVALGKKRKEISEQLFLSERTVSNHLQHIFEKLEVSSALEAVAKGVKLGYIQS